MSAEDEFVVTQERDPWVRTPIWLLTAVSPQAVVAYCHIANYVDLPDGARPSLARLAKDAKVSRATMKRAVAELETAGACKVEHRWAPDRRPLPSRYHLVVTEPGGRVKSDPRVMDE